jgi:hypothetical protein
MRRCKSAASATACSSKLRHCPPSAADHPLEESLDQSPARASSRVIRGRREDAMQMIWQDDACGHRERIAIAAGAERKLQRVHMLGQRARALVRERGGEEMLCSRKVFAAGIHDRDCPIAVALAPPTFG